MRRKLRHIGTSKCSRLATTAVPSSKLSGANNPLYENRAKNDRINAALRNRNTGGNATCSENGAFRGSCGAVAGLISDRVYPATYAVSSAFCSRLNQQSECKL